MIEQNYRFPSRAECTQCHTNAAKFALGVNTMQMNRDHNYDGVIANQLATFDHIGLFTKKLAEKPPSCRDSRTTITRRSRSTRVLAPTCTPIAAIAT
jgi:hypothetical protein